MKLWICGNDLQEMKRWMDYGIFEGILTNPDIVAASGINRKAYFKKLCAISDGPVFYQLETTTEEDMHKDAISMLQVDEKIKIKVPASRAGMGVMSTLARDGHDVLATCVPDLSTLLLSVKFGAKWITPYGSLWNPFVQEDKESLLRELQAVVLEKNLEAEIIVGIKDPSELRRFALAGISSFFIWVQDLPGFFDLPMVIRAEESFANSWLSIHEFGL
ncbi:transaldolase family protein [Paenibacillus chungangensis]|uniref:Transaldolase family protein n=1 Tax=Paenibacillus chungangensis TaxID=696535 RepID=A0ABW3HV06_9BACL